MKKMNDTEEEAELHDMERHYALLDHLESLPTFRDQCAIAVMSALLSRADTYIPYGAVHSSYAEIAYTQADAMEAERQKRTQP